MGDTATKPEYQPRHVDQPGPYLPTDWKPPVCPSCNEGGLFIGESDVCVKCEGDRALCSCCGKRPRGRDLLCAECEREDHWG